MSNDKTDYHEAQVLDRIFANATPDGAVDGVYIALWATTPTNNPDPTNEVSGDSYSPVQVTASGWTVDQSAAPRRYVNASDIDFGVLDTTTDKTVAGIVLYDGADTSTANAVYIDDEFGSTTVPSGDEFKINAGDQSVAED